MANPGLIMTLTRLNGTIYATEIQISLHQIGPDWTEEAWTL